MNVPSAYHATGELVASAMENTIKKVCTDKVVTDYMKKWNYPKVMYECTSLSIHSTAYKPGQYVILPSSTNDLPAFGKIVKLLACNQFGYLCYQETNNEYCHKRDIYMVSNTQNFAALFHFSDNYF